MFHLILGFQLSMQLSEVSILSMPILDIFSGHLDILEHHCLPAEKQIFSSEVISMYQRSNLEHLVELPPQEVVSSSIHFTMILPMNTWEH